MSTRTPEIDKAIRRRQEKHARAGVRRALYIVLADGPHQGRVLDGNGTLSLHRDNDPSSGIPVVVLHLGGGHLVGYRADQLEPVNQEAVEMVSLINHGATVIR